MKRQDVKSPLLAYEQSDLGFRLLGLLPLLFFIAQGFHYWRLGQLSQMLWLCNIGNLLLAVGLFLNSPILIRVAVIWLIPGLLVWYVYVVRESGMVLSSTLAHIGGLLVGLLALTRVRFAHSVWLYAFGWYLIVQGLSRLSTPVPLNINVSQRTYGGWEQTFTAYWKFWVVLSAAVAGCLWLVAFALSKIWPIASPEANATAS